MHVGSRKSSQSIRIARLVLFGLMCLLGSHTRLHAQTLSSSPLNSISFDGQFSIAFDHPTLAADGNTINCVYPTAHCVPFNLAACNRLPGLPIEMVVTHGTEPYPSPLGPLPITQLNAFAWVQNSAGICTTSTAGVSTAATSDSNSSGATLVSIPGLVPGQVGITPQYLSTSSALVYPGQGTALDIPLSFGTTSPIYMGNLMNAFPGVCPDANGNGGVQLTQFKLCFGINAAGNNGININGTSSSTVTGSGQDIVGFFEFPVDTVPPPPPTLNEAVGLYKRISLDFNYDITYLEVYGVQVVWTADANAIASNNCQAWATDTNLIEGQSMQTVSQSAGSGSFDIPGTNGVTVAICAQAIDLMGNISDFSNPLTATPQFECDFFGCFPDPLYIGYCGSDLPGSGYLCLATLLVYFKYRRRQGVIP